MQKESDLATENARLHGDLLTISSRVSHDLRTPLGGIAATGQLLHEILAENNLPVSFTQSILDSVDDMTRLIKQISFVTRATAKPLPRQVNQANVGCQGTSRSGLGWRRRPRAAR